MNTDGIKLFSVSFKYRKTQVVTSKNLTYISKSSTTKIFEKIIDVFVAIILLTWQKNLNRQLTIITMFYLFYHFVVFFYIQRIKAIYIIVGLIFVILFVTEF